jgi:hypothetical protein
MRKLLEGARNLIHCWRHGDWSFGCEWYKGKPIIGLVFTYYDGYIFAAHLGPLWAECDC